MSGSISDELSVLNQIGQAISGSTTRGVRPLLKLIHKQASRLMDVSNFFIALYDEPSESVEFKFAIEEGVLQEVGKNEWSPRTRGYGITEYVIGKRESQFIQSNVSSWLDTHCVKLVGRLPESWMGALLVARDKVIGVMAAQSYSSKIHYSIENFNLLTAIASQAAIAIDNARLFHFQQALISSVPHPVIAVDKRGRVTHVNEAAEEIVGEGRRAIVGRPVQSYYWGGVNEARRVANILDNPTARNSIETFVKSSDNKKIPVHLSAAPIRGEEQEIMGSVAVLEDLRMAALRGRIRRLVYAIEALNSSNELSQILETLTIEAAALFDADSAVVFLFREGALLPMAPVGVTEEELDVFIQNNGASILRSGATQLEPTILSGEGYKGISEAAKSAMVLPIAIHEVHVGALLLEGHESDCFSSPESALVDTLARQAAVAINRAQLLEERELIQGQLIRSANAIAAGQIAAGVSHEVRNGLNNIRLALINVQEELQREHVAKRVASLTKTLKTAESDTFRLAGLADRLHRFSQRLEPTKRPIYVNEIITNTLALLAGTLESNGSKVRQDLDPSLNRPATGLGNTIRADERQLQQVIVNLVLNALDASSARGPIFLQTRFKREKPLGAEITVRDYGAGIKSSDVSHIFEPFFTTKDSGTGLGLYICELIVVENHRGRIEVQSKEGKGSTFVVFLPSE